VDVRARLHVDPDQTRHRLGARHQALEVVIREPWVQVEPEVRELDRDLGVEPGLGSQGERVFVGSGGRFGGRLRGDVLSQLVEDGPDVGGGQLPAGGEGGGEVLARHEAADGTAGETPVLSPAAQPHLPGRPQQGAAAQAHGWLSRLEEDG